MAETAENLREDSIEVTEPWHRQRADKVLAGLCPDLSRSQWQKLFVAGRVWRDDDVLSQKDTLRMGETVQYSIPPAQPLELRPIEMPLSIIYEDDDWLALNKEAGRVVHPGNGTGEDTLVHGLLHHCAGQLSGIGGKERPGIVHRLDKETTGVLVVAKSDKAFQALSRQFAERTLQKTYLAIVSGIPRETSGSIDAPIGRHPAHRLRMAVRPEGRSAQSSWKLIRPLDERFALLEVKIHTGRTHQIRVHLSHIGHPLAGDILYGFKPKPTDPQIPRILLHAWKLELQHPVTNQPILLEAPVPQDMYPTSTFSVQS